LYLEKKTVKAGFHRSDIAFICYCRHSAFYYPYEIDFEVVSSSKSLALLTANNGYLCECDCVKILLSKWSDQINKSNNDDTNNAGKYRFWSAYLFSFCLDKFWEGIGFYWQQNLFSDLETLKSLRMLNLLNTF
jgi:hypothetical protein